MVTELFNFKRSKIFANILTLQRCNSVMAYYKQLRDSQKNFVFCQKKYLVRCVAKVLYVLDI